MLSTKLLSRLLRHPLFTHDADEVPFRLRIATLTQMCLIDADSRNSFPTRVLPQDCRGILSYDLHFLCIFRFWLGGQAADPECQVGANGQPAVQIG